MKWLTCCSDLICVIKYIPLWNFTTHIHTFLFETISVTASVINLHLNTISRWQSMINHFNWHFMLTVPKYKISRYESPSLFIFFSMVLFWYCRKTLKFWIIGNELWSNEQVYYHITTGWGIWYYVLTKIIASGP